MTEQQIDLQERELDYWMTRAYEAEGKLWKAEKRVKAVRDELAQWDDAPEGSAMPVHGAADLIRRALEG